jgi:tRNA threonylcarbamoyl adenosine modification protein (Sua5/YciO/YrdC/YwlC family)
MPKILDTSQNSLNKALELLNSEDVVAIPTETVYGLAASAASTKAVEKVFKIKGRPSFNPIISHYANLDEIFKDVIYDERVIKLAESFWPGPLTIILNKTKNSRISEIVCAGLNTAGVRIPRHPFTLELLRQFAAPVAAPSANPSGRLSPSSAAHVAKLFQDYEAGESAEIGVSQDGTAHKRASSRLRRTNDRSVRVISSDAEDASHVSGSYPSKQKYKLDSSSLHEDHEDDENAEIGVCEQSLEWIVDGGNCECGLESTVLDLSSSLPKLLRYGSVSVMELKTILGEIALPEQDESIRSPGMLLKHYAPKCKLRLNYSFNDKPRENEALIAFGSIAESLTQSQSRLAESDLKFLFKKIINISPSADLDEAASKLFSSLHELESLGVDSIVVMPIPYGSVGQAINDRLLRAARGAEGDDNTVHD